MSELSDLEDVVAVTSYQGNVGSGARHNFRPRWSVSPAIERASVAREKSKKMPPPVIGKAPDAAKAVQQIQPGVAVAGNGGSAVNGAPQYELYRVIWDYEALQDGFLDRIEDLETTLEQIDMAGEFARGNTQKLLSKIPGKAIQRHRDSRTDSARRTFGWKSLGKMLKGTGLALVLVIDDERFAPIRAQLAQRERPRPPAGKLDQKSCGVNRGSRADSKYACPHDTSGTAGTALITG
jgi:hypothetical protein